VKAQGWHFVKYDLWILLYRLLGPVTSVGVGRLRYFYLLGPEANRFVLTNPQIFDSRGALEALVPAIGETALLVSGGPEHRRRRRMVQPAFHPRHVDGYLQIMGQKLDDAVDTWQDGQVINLYQEMRDVIRRGTIEALFGQRLTGDAESIGQQLQILIDMANGLPPVLRIHVRLGTPQWRRAMAARAWLDKRIYTEIARVQENPGIHRDDVLALLVCGRDEEGDGLSDVEIRDQTISTIAAGYETTSAAATWAIWALLMNGSWERAKVEIENVSPGRLPGPAEVKHLRYLRAVVYETLRLYSPIVISARRTTQDVTFCGRRIPHGRLVLYSPYVTHRLTELWPDARQFRPERWDPSQPGYHRPGFEEYLPFGGGPHRCIGENLAIAEMMLVLARLLPRVSFKLLTRRMAPTGYTSMRPRGGLPVLVYSA
jgi:cytochrome P450